MILEVLTEGIPVAALLVLVAAAGGGGGRGGGCSASGGGGDGVGGVGVTRSVHELLEGVHGKLEALGVEIQGGNGIAFLSLCFNKAHLGWFLF